MISLVAKINYDKHLQELISNLEYKPKLLLHSCCGPCSSYVITYLKDYFDLTILFYNPNIEPTLEYELRLSEQVRLLKELNIPHVKMLDTEYENEVYRSKVLGLENEKEGGSRCKVCYYLRLEKTAVLAKKYGFEYFATTLTVSPYKNAQVLNEIGKTLAELHQVKWLYSDFKKQEGYKKSIELSKKYELYRQDYCGCLFSKEYLNNK